MGTVAGQAFNQLLNGDVPSFSNWMLAACIIFLAMMMSLTYASASRTCLILSPHSRRTWLAPTLITVPQGIVHAFAAYYWYINFTTGGDPAEIKVSAILLMGYICVCEGTLFALCQYRIVATTLEARKGRTAGAAWVSYVKAVVRCLAFILTVAVLQLTFSNMVFPETTAWCFVAYNPVLLYMIMLTDGGRLQELLDRLRGVNVSTSGGRSEAANSKVWAIDSNSGGGGVTSGNGFKSDMDPPQNGGRGSFYPPTYGYAREPLEP
ncbi:hypothetical protein HK101_009049 [Irineochytrium annulatum]|nr:hypothetical protein HK101_009049 [Irineochytrium annulatum]